MRLLPALLLSGCTSLTTGDVVVLVSIDTLRADHVGLYGHTRATTPEIDAYFTPGTVYEQASASAPCTIPGVRQMLSGGYDLAPERPRIAELFQEAGWRTRAVTSQHMFKHDEDGAYDRGFDRFDRQGDREADPYGMSTRTADDVVDGAIASLHRRPWEEDGPTFLWMHFFDPHDPYLPPKPYDAWDEGYTGTRDGDRRKYLMAERPDAKWAWMEAGHIFSEADVAHFRALYDGEIAFADHHLGRFFDFLEASGLDERATVLLTADHGEWLGEDGNWDHCRTLHERETHVPLMVRHRGGPIEGARQAGAVSTLDVLPTLVGLAGLTLPQAVWHGRDLRGSPADRPVVSMWRSRRAVRTSTHKLLVQDGIPRGLFNVQTDAGMQTDLSASAPDLVTQLLAVLTGLPELDGRVAEENDETTKLLQQLGYVDVPQE